MRKKTIEKKIGNIKTIMKTEESLKSLIRLVEGIKMLIKNYENVWTITLLRKVEIPELFPHSFSKFILVSNEIEDINKLREILKITEKRRFYLNSLNFKFRFLNLIEGFLVFELKNV